MEERLLVPWEKSKEIVAKKIVVSKRCLNITTRFWSSIIKADYTVIYKNGKKEKNCNFLEHENPNMLL
ncbi:MAG: hypothetical protein DHS20C17_33440 [Cyclobacteriaceae bacterium]|nr:MAG: hypothetical protein DHS20C17_33440 [Cyclobacteriaceae bacterium]